MSLDVLDDASASELWKLANGYDPDEPYFDFSSSALEIGTRQKPMSRPQSEDPDEVIFIKSSKKSDIQPAVQDILEPQSELEMALGSTDYMNDFQRAAIIAGLAVLLPATDPQAMSALLYARRLEAGSG